MGITIDGTLHRTALGAPPDLAIRQRGSDTAGFFFHEIGEGDLGEDAAQMIARLYPDAVDSAIEASMAGLGTDDAVIQKDFADNRFDDIQQGDLFRTLYETVSTLRPLQDLDYTGLGKLLRNLGQEMAGHIAFFSDLLPTDQLTVAFFGQIQNTSDRIFPSSC